MKDDTQSAVDSPCPRELTLSVKYIFLDVVQFTHNRNVEAQSEIVNVLNKIVLEAIATCDVKEDARLFIPTGDGLCIALKTTEGRYPYDVHMRIALAILRLVEAFNGNEPDEMRRFQVRIGVNSNEDNLIRDINGQENLAGAGISLASRIMDKADGGQILIGESVFERLQQREAYMNRLKSFNSTDKHGKPFRLHQYIGESPGLNTEIPRAFGREPLEKLTTQMAFYLAYSIKHKEFISKTLKASTIDADVLQPLLYMLSIDASESIASAKSESRLFHATTWKFNEAPFEEQFEYYRSLRNPLNRTFTALITDYLTERDKDGTLFNRSGLWVLFVSDEGKAKLKAEFPDIWNSWGLN